VPRAPPSRWNGCRSTSVITHMRPSCGSPPAAIYLDDQLSGQSVVNNTIIDSHTGLLLGGGRDNYVHGNSFRNLSSGLAMTFDNRGMNWQSSTCSFNATYSGA